MGLLDGLPMPSNKSPEDRVAETRYTGNLGRGLLSLFSMGQANANAGDAKAMQGAADSKVGQVAGEIAQTRGSGGDTLKVMDIFRKNGSLFNNPLTREGMTSLAQNEAATEKMMEGFEKAKVDTIVKQNQQKLLSKQVEMASAVLSSGEEGAKAAAYLFRPDDKGNTPVFDLNNFNPINDQFKMFVKGPEEARKAAEESAAIARGDIQIRTGISKAGVTKTFSPPPTSLVETETITEKFPATEGEPAKSASSGIFGIGARPAKEAVPATPERSVTRKVPVGGKSNAAPKSKVDRANELANDHPEWTKEQVIKAVNDEMP